MIEWTCVGETPVIDKDEYYFAIEELRKGEDQMIFVHLLVYDHTVSIYKEILRNWHLFRQCVTCPVFAVAGVKDTVKWEKFVSRLGFQYLMDIYCENGEPRRLFVHYANNKKQNEPLVQPIHGHDAEPEYADGGPNQSVGRTGPVSDAGVPDSR